MGSLGADIEVSFCVKVIYWEVFLGKYGKEMEVGSREGKDELSVQYRRKFASVPQGISDDNGGLTSELA